MNRTASIYLDLVRFIAALLVFFYHAKYAQYNGAWLKGIGVYGHDAVMVFFVLSGFVIAYITHGKETTLDSYSKSRLARLYSVAIPALLLTLVLDYFGQQLSPRMYRGGFYHDSEPVYRFFSNLFFVNELWFKSWRAFSNGPFWSLAYEFWYYVIFASYFYFSGIKKWVLCGCAALIAGPKIVILLPIWVMGVITFHASQKLSAHKIIALVLAISPIIIYAAYRHMGYHTLLLRETIEVLGRDFVVHDLRWSRRFLNDYIVGGLVSVHFLGMIALAKYFSFPGVLEKIIRYLAGITFSLYLIHTPLLQFYGSIFRESFVIILLTLLSVMVFAPFTEGRKRQWRVLIDCIFLFLIKLFRTLQNRISRN